MIRAPVVQVKSTRSVTGRSKQGVNRPYVCQDFMENKLKLGTYKHYKGMKVEVIGVALHSETMEELVVYNHPDPIKGKGSNTLWMRPLKMFLETVEVDGEKMSRFKFIDES